MKKLVLIAIAATLLASAASFAQVTGTKHDLSATLATGSQICVFCHTPHNANLDAQLLGRAPLWNQDINDAAQSYGVYASDTFNGTDIAAVTRAVFSTTLLCLSCHDGTVAPGSFYNEPNPTGNTSSAVAITGNANLGTDLSNDHPVNFTYSVSQLADGAANLVAAPPAGYLDGLGKMQCSGCHDPHDQAAVKDVDVNFMNNTLAGSALCLDCHVK